MNNRPRQVAKWKAKYINHRFKKMDIQLNDTKCIIVTFAAQGWCRKEKTMGRLIDTVDLMQYAFGHRNGLIHTADIDKCPTAQPEIIMCKDCNKNYGSEHNPRCDYMDAHLWPDSFCSYGERREDARTEIDRWCRYER